MTPLLPPYNVEIMNESSGFKMLQTNDFFFGKWSKVLINTAGILIAAGILKRNCEFEV